VFYLQKIVSLQRVLSLLIVNNQIGMSRSNPVWSFISHNKYWLVIIIGLLITGVVDENSFMKRMKLDMQIRELKEQIDVYNAQYAKDQAKLKDIRMNPSSITKIARERYFMKADDEDIFVLSDDLPSPANETAK
jgi:cell division protein FtsB